MVRSTGAIEFDGAPLTGRSTEHRPPRHRACAAGPRHLHHHDSEENLQLGAITRSDKAGSSRHRTHVRPLPGAESAAYPAGGTLSGGEQQMLAVARALMLRPRLMLLTSRRSAWRR